ncbi:MAG: class I mannose-6-phosphate isomerase [Pyrinomonadaceae bacterium]|nr:class I mannose-6-phosphate isomerase [Phycisphaerales bacterium]
MSTHPVPPPMYPLLLRPMLFPKVWGGDRLALFGKHVKHGDHIGEAWELADLDSTSASGAGGGAARSIIVNGPLQGRTLREAHTLFGRDFLGHATPPHHDSAPFPLLVKYLDARENLSVQVHPSIAYAKAHPAASIKTECWYILDAEPGSVIYKGLRPGVLRKHFEKHLHGKNGEGVVADLEAVPAIPGHMHNLPSGTVHALGAGVLVAEVQTPSDTTFRVYDWGRSGRELHVAQALDCITYGPARDATFLPPEASIGRLVSTGFFIVDELHLASDAPPGSTLVDTMRLATSAGPEALALSNDRAVVLMIVDGDCELRWSEHSHDAIDLTRGNTVVVPAALVDTCIMTTADTAKMLRVTTLGM